MALECDTVLEVATATSARVSESITATLESIGTAVAAFTLTAILVAAPANSAHATSAITLESYYAGIADTAYATSSLPTSQTISLLASNAKAQSLVFSKESVLVEETAEADSTVIDRVVALTVERATASSTVLQATTASFLISETAKAQSSVPFPAGVTVVEEHATAASAAFAGVIAHSLAASSALAQSEITSESDQRASVLESSASAHSAIFQQVEAFQMVMEEAEADAEVLQGGQGQVWSASTDSMGMTRWDAELTHINAFRNGWLALQNGNIVKLDWSMAYSRGVDPVIKSRAVTGLMDFNDPTLKHVTYFRASYATADTLSVKVSNTGSGNEVGFVYPLEPRTANALVPSRAKLGRGARSRYWRVEIANVESPFELRDAWLEIDSLTRKL
jgi:hypothetical protein